MKSELISFFSLPNSLKIENKSPEILNRINLQLIGDVRANSYYHGAEAWRLGHGQPQKTSKYIVSVKPCKLQECVNLSVTQQSFLISYCWLLGRSSRKLGYNIQPVTRRKRRPGLSLWPVCIVLTACNDHLAVIKFIGLFPRVLK